MVWFCAQSDRFTLSCFDLNQNSIGGYGVMAFCPCWEKRKAITVSRNDFADTAHKMTIRSKPATRKQALKLTDDHVELCYKCRYGFDRVLFHTINRKILGPEKSVFGLKNMKVSITTEFSRLERNHQMVNLFHS